MGFASCCCPTKEYDDVRTGASVDNKSSSKPPAKQSMKREGDGDSDYKAVAWMRNRSTDSSKRVELSADAALAWEKAGKAKQMATENPIEVDDISALHRHGHYPETASTSSSYDLSTQMPTNRPEPDGGDGKPATTRTKPRDAAELDAIVMALKERESFPVVSPASKSSNGYSPSVSHLSSSQRRMSPNSSYRSDSPSRRSSPPMYTARNVSRSPSPGQGPTQSRSRSPRRSPPLTVAQIRPASPRRSPIEFGEAPPAFTSKPHPDSLSDIPSYVDPSIRERYLMACRLLKSTLIERETALLPQEKQFLTGLLEQTDPTDETVSAIETASNTLLSDPLFSVDSVHSSMFHTQDDEQRQAARDSAKAAWQQRSIEKDRGRESRHQVPALADETLTDTGTDITGSATGTVARVDGQNFPFYILGVTPDFKVGVLTPTLMESLRGFFPNCVQGENFWLKYSLQRDGASLPTLLSRVRTSRHTILGVETTDGYVFGAFCSSPWRVQDSWFGCSEAFLWRLKRSRLVDGPASNRRNFSHDNEMEVYPYAGKDDLIQYCTKKTIAIGGGDWSSKNKNPYPGEPTGIGFMIDGDLMGGETNSCASFANPRLGNRLNDTNEFDIRSLEIWTITPCTAIAEAERLEMHRLFVEEQIMQKK